MNNPDDPRDTRLTNLEISVTHLQHHYDQLHEVVLGLQTDLRQLREAIQKMSSQIDRLGEEPDVRSPELERPPHY